MSRDPSKLKVFHLADELVVEGYRATRGFPVEERYGLQAQLRRAAVSVPTNIVEGCARNSERDYLHFVDMAIASASEVRYLLGLSARLGILKKADQEPLVRRYDELIRSVQKLLTVLRNPMPGA
jgi:four helix bundle protein